MFCFRILADGIAAIAPHQQARTSKMVRQAWNYSNGVI
jgi:hypothetical protein